VQLGGQGCEINRCRPSKTVACPFMQSPSKAGLVHARSMQGQSSSSEQGHSLMRQRRKGERSIHGFMHGKGVQRDILRKEVECKALQREPRVMPQGFALPSGAAASSVRAAHGGGTAAAAPRQRRHPTAAQGRQRERGQHRGPQNPPNSTPQQRKAGDTTRGKKERTGCEGSRIGRVVRHRSVSCHPGVVGRQGRPAARGPTSFRAVKGRQQPRRARPQDGAGLGPPRLATAVVQRQTGEGRPAPRAFGSATHRGAPPAEPVKKGRPASPHDSPLSP
jgi:hypothetical protein